MRRNLKRRKRCRLVVELFVHSVDLGRQHEVTFRKPLNLVRENLDATFAPRNTQIWVVPLLFCDRRNVVCQKHRLHESRATLEGVSLRQLGHLFTLRAFGDRQPPARSGLARTIQFRQERLHFILGECGNVAAARSALAVAQQHLLATCDRVIFHAVSVVGHDIVLTDNALT